MPNGERYPLAGGAWTRRRNGKSPEPDKRPRTRRAATSATPSLILTVLLIGGCIPNFTLTRLCFAISFAKLFHSLDRRLHQLFQDLLVHIVECLDIQTSHASCELAKFF